MKSLSFTYEIKVEGLIDHRWAEWFDGMSLSYINEAETVLIGQIQDQTALHGILERIRDLGLNLISVRRIGTNA
jgi:hypothetical protein